MRGWGIAPGLRNVMAPSCLEICFVGERLSDQSLISEFVEAELLLHHYIEKGFTFVPCARWMCDDPLGGMDQQNF